MTRLTTPLTATALTLTLGLGLATTPAADAAILAGDVIVIDLGPNTQQTAGNWNNVGEDANDGLDGASTEAIIARTITSDLIRFSDGASTNVGLNLQTVKSDSGAFAGIGGASVTTDSDLSFTSSGVIPNSAQQDLSFYNQGEIILTFTGLDNSLTYNLELMSKIDTARNANNWIVNKGLGSAQQTLSVEPDVVPYIQGFTNVVTDGSGNITLYVNTGDADGAATAHLNALELTAIPEPASLALLGLGGLRLLGGRRRA